MIYFNDDMAAPADGEDMTEGAAAPAMEGGDDAAATPAEGGDAPAAGGEEAAPAAEGEAM